MNSVMQRELLLRQFKGKKITGLWYEGDTVIGNTNHSVSKKVYLQLDGAEVYCIYPDIQSSTPIVHVLQVKEQKRWQREKREIDSLRDMSTHASFKACTIASIKLNWSRMNASALALGTMHSRGYRDYPQDLEMNAPMVYSFLFLSRRYGTTLKWSWDITS